MKKSKAIEKITIEEALIKLSEQSDLASRGLADLEKHTTLDELQDQMFELFKTQEYEACIKLCKKIFKIDPNIAIVRLLYETSKSRIQKLPKRKR